MRHHIFLLKILFIQQLTHGQSVQQIQETLLNQFKNTKFYFVELPEAPDLSKNQVPL